MAEQKPWGSMDPNSGHQMWSRWTFTIMSPKVLPRNVVIDNARRWAKAGFGSVGRIRVAELRNALPPFQHTGYTVMLEVEGPPAHDPEFRNAVGRDFRRKFVDQGWGSSARLTLNVAVLAGDQQDGKPPSQLIVMPNVVPKL